MSFCKINRKFIPLTAILTFSTLVIIKIAAFPASKIPFGNYELIDEYLLATTPLASIFCLSSQPPGHNTLIALSLHIGKHLKIEPGFIFATLTYLIGSLGAASLAYLFATLGMGGGGGVLLTLLLFLYPGTIRQFNNYGYTAFVFSIFNIFLGIARFSFQKFNLKVVLLAYFAVLLIVLTRTLFPPVFCSALFFIFLLLQKTDIPHFKQNSLLYAFVISFLFIWPLKNFVVYGKLTNSSWTGYNLARSLPVSRKNAMWDYISHGKSSENALRAKENYLPICRNSAVINQITKLGGARNWHNFNLLETMEMPRTAAIKWRLQNPVAFAQRALAFYFISMSPSFVHPYSGKPWFKGDNWISKIAAVFQGVIFYDLRPTIAKVLNLENLPVWFRLKYGSPVPFTLFGVVIFPFVTVSSIVILIRKRCELDESDRTVCLALFVLLWNVLIPISTDGAESNRMVFCSFGLFIYLFFWLFAKFFELTNKPPVTMLTATSTKSTA